MALTGETEPAAPHQPSAGTAQSEQLAAFEGVGFKEKGMRLHLPISGDLVQRFGALGQSDFAVWRQARALSCAAKRAVTSWPWHRAKCFLRQNARFRPGDNPGPRAALL